MDHLDAILENDPSFEIPQWHKEIIDERLKNYKLNLGNITDLDSLLDELEQEILWKY